MTPAPATIARYVSPPAAAELLGIDPERVRAWIVRGKPGQGHLKATNVGDAGQPRWRINLDDLREFLDRGAAVPPAPVKKRRTAKVDRDFIEYSERM